MKPISHKPEVTLEVDLTYLNIGVCVVEIQFITVVHFVTHFTIVVHIVETYFIIVEGAGEPCFS